MAPSTLAIRSYFDELAQFGEDARLDKELSKLSTSRGNAHALYLNRTYFGLYHLVGSLNGMITTKLPEYAEAIPVLRKPPATRFPNTHSTL